MTGFSQFERGVDPHDRADGDADPADGKPPECQREGCSHLQRDGFAGCCSVKCAMVNADDSAGARSGESDPARAPQEAD